MATYAEDMEEHQKMLQKLLGLSEETNWAEIYEAIGKLKEKSNKPADIHYYPNPVMPLVNNNPNLHYHGNSPCYNNPCVWC